MEVLHKNLVNSSVHTTQPNTMTTFKSPPPPPSHQLSSFADRPFSEHRGEKHKESKLSVRTSGKFTPFIDRASMLQQKHQTQYPARDAKMDHPLPRKSSIETNCVVLKDSEHPLSFQDHPEPISRQNQSPISPLPQGIWQSQTNSVVLNPNFETAKKFDNLNQRQATEKLWQISSPEQKQLLLKIAQANTDMNTSRTQHSVSLTTKMRPQLGLKSQSHVDVLKDSALTQSDLTPRSFGEPIQKQEKELKPRSGKQKWSGFKNDFNAVFKRMTQMHKFNPFDNNKSNSFNMMHKNRYSSQRAQTSLPKINKEEASKRLETAYGSSQFDLFKPRPRSKHGVDETDKKSRNLTQQAYGLRATKSVEELEPVPFSQTLKTNFQSTTANLNARFESVSKPLFPQTVKSNRVIKRVGTSSKFMVQTSNEFPDVPVHSKYETMTPTYQTQQEQLSKTDLIQRQYFGTLPVSPASKPLKQKNGSPARERLRNFRADQAAYLHHKVCSASDGQKWDPQRNHEQDRVILPKPGDSAKNFYKSKSTKLKIQGQVGPKIDGEGKFKFSVHQNTNHGGVIQSEDLKKGQLQTYKAGEQPPVGSPKRVKKKKQKAKPKTLNYKVKQVKKQLYEIREYADCMLDSVASKSIQEASQEVYEMTPEKLNEQPAGQFSEKNIQINDLQASDSESKPSETQQNLLEVQDQANEERQNQNNSREMRGFLHTNQKLQMITVESMTTQTEQDTLTEHGKVELLKNLYQKHVAAKDNWKTPNLTEDKNQEQVENGKDKYLTKQQQELFMRRYQNVQSVSSYQLDASNGLEEYKIQNMKFKDVITHPQQSPVPTIPVELTQRTHNSKPTETLRTQKTLLSDKTIDIMENQSDQENSPDGPRGQKQGSKKMGQLVRSKSPRPKGNKVEGRNKSRSKSVRKRKKVKQVAKEPEKKQFWRPTSNHVLERHPHPEPLPPVQKLKPKLQALVDKPPKRSRKTVWVPEIQYRKEKRMKSQRVKTRYDNKDMQEQQINLEIKPATKKKKRNKSIDSARQIKQVDFTQQKNTEMSVEESASKEPRRRITRNISSQEVELKANNTATNGFSGAKLLLDKNSKYYYIENNERKERPLTGKLTPSAGLPVASKLKVDLDRRRNSNLDDARAYSTYSDTDIRSFRSKVQSVTKQKEQLRQSMLKSSRPLSGPDLLSSKVQTEPSKIEEQPDEALEVSVREGESIFDADSPKKVTPVLNSQPGKMRVMTMKVEQSVLNIVEEEGSVHKQRLTQSSWHHNCKPGSSTSVVSKLNRSKTLVEVQISETESYEFKNIDEEKKASLVAQKTQYLQESKPVSRQSSNVALKPSSRRTSMTEPKTSKGSKQSKRLRSKKRSKDQSESGSATSWEYYSEEGGEDEMTEPRSYVSPKSSSIAPLEPIDEKSID